MKRHQSIVAAAVFAVAALVTPIASEAGAGRARSGASDRVIWRAPRDPLRRAVEAGLKPAREEFLIHHVHAHLDVFVDRKAVTVPAGIGINIHDRAVHRFTLSDGSVGYGGIDPACRKPCISPLHTHDNTGILHTESKTPRPNRLGQFFTEWGVRLSPSCVGDHCAPEAIRFYVNGKPYAKDPRRITLTDHKEIAVVIGAPPARIPKSEDFSDA